MICRNGHEIEARVPRSDGWSVCPVCLRESTARRNKRYYQAHRERLLERRRQLAFEQQRGW